MAHYKKQYHNDDYHEGATISHGGVTWTKTKSPYNFGPEFFWKPDSGKATTIGFNQSYRDYPYRIDQRSYETLERAMVVAIEIAKLEYTRALKVVARYEGKE